MKYWNNLAAKWLIKLCGNRRNIVKEDDSATISAIQITDLLIYLNENHKIGTYEKREKVDSWRLASLGSQ